MVDDHQEPSVSIGEDGHRVVSWPVELTDGAGTFEHHFPDALQHHYRAAGADEDVFLYRGTFTLSDADAEYDGDVRWRWGRTPRIELRGTRPATSSDLHDLLSGAEGSMWVQGPTLAVNLPDGALPQQPREPVAEVVNQGRWVTDRVEQELGDPAALERVTFLIPNGWPGRGATGICDAADLTRLWYGRTEAAGDGWRVTLDRCAEMDNDAWRELQDVGGHRFTHVGELTRDDRSTFTGEAAFEALDRVRLGLNLALGRRTACALPVGWRGDQPVWCGWRSARVDPYQSLGSTHWLDETIVHQQVRDVVSLVLTFTADKANRGALRPAAGYYIAGNVDVDVELSVSVPVSALQLLAYYRFVAQRATYSHSAWRKTSTEDQVQLLLNELKVDTAVQPHFKHFTDVRNRLALTSAPRDALGVVIQMRNVVTHPTRNTPTTFSVYEWAEAGLHARYWLCLALLNTVGYQGEIAAVLQEQPPWSGQLQASPWAPNL